MKTVLLSPGKTLGIIGDYFNVSRILEVAGQAGLKTIVYTTNENEALKHQADKFYVGNLDDKNKLMDFAKQCDVVTYTTDLIKPAILSYLENYTKIPQGKEFLELTQDRAIEHVFLANMGVASVPYVAVASTGDIRDSITQIGYPAMLKPILKNTKQAQQFKINSADDLDVTSSLFQHGAYILEASIKYKQLFSITAVKNNEGKISLFSPVEVKENNDQLQVINKDEYDVNNQITKKISLIAQRIGSNINYVGAYEVIYGLTEDDDLIIKEIKPTLSKYGYVYNVGTNTNMYEQHLRAISNLPLAEIKKYTDVLLQTFVRRQVPAVLQLRTQYPEWKFIFDYKSDAIDDELSGCVFVQSNDIKQAIDAINLTNIWD